MTTGPRVLVTRPIEQAVDWLASLRAEGFDTVAVPLIAVVAADPARVRAAWHRLAARRAVMFVSPSAVEQFFAQRPASARWPAHTLAATPGPGTAQALERHGVPAAQLAQPAADAAQFDAEALWAVLQTQSWQAASVLIVHGDGGRATLAERWRSAGASVDLLSAYRRDVPRWSDSTAAVADAAIVNPAAHVWLFSSSQGIDHLLTLRSSVDWGAARALATHPRIAARAREAGFGRVHTCRPPLADVIAALHRLADDSDPSP